MLVGAIATGVLASQAAGGITFVLSDLAKAPSTGSQDWIFLVFALAFLIKMPSFPFHGWMPDGYMQMPIAVLAVFTAILSKVAAYGFLRSRCRCSRTRRVKYQELLMLVALASILYGSAMAFTATRRGSSSVTRRSPSSASSSSGSSRSTTRGARRRAAAVGQPRARRPRR